MLYIVSRHKQKRLSTSSTLHQEPVRCIQPREDEPGFPSSPCLVLLCKLLWSSVEIGESSPLCFLLHSAVVGNLFYLAEEMVFHSSTCSCCSACSGLAETTACSLECNHCCVRFRLWSFSWSCTFGKSSEQGLHQKHFCFVQCVCHNQELNWTEPILGGSEADHSFWSLVQYYSTGLGWHSVHSMLWLVALFMDVCCNPILIVFLLFIFTWGGKNL